MPRYFFDIQNGDRSLRDGYGMDCPDVSQAIAEASLIIEQLAEQAQAEGRRGTIAVTLRTVTDACLYEISTSVISD